MDELCCADFDKYEFPVFTCTTEEAKAASSGQTARPRGQELKEEGRTDSPKPLTRKESVRGFDVTQGMSNLSLALSLGKYTTYPLPW